MEAVKDKVKSILVETMGLPETAVTDDAHLGRDLGVDSLDFAELVMEFEQEFDIRIPHEDAEMLHNVGDVENYVISKVTEKS